VTRFSECFLLVFAQLAVGGVAALAVPPFAALERGFYKSSAGVFLGSTLVFLAGRLALLARSPAATSGRPLELALWFAFAVLLGWYLASLWGSSSPARARTYAATLLAGVLALSVSANAYRLGPAVGPIAPLYPLAFVTAALALGAIATGMLLGHWYLIDLGLSIEPLRRLFRYVVSVTVAQVAALSATVLLPLLTSGPAADAAQQLWHDHRALLAARLFLGPGATLGVAYLIHRTLAIPHTMAATGLFYVAILATMVGEMLGRLLLFRTSLPL
jgi:hypothetical protein